MAHLTVFHYNVNSAIVSLNDPIVILHDARMVQFSEQINFGDQHLFFSIAHVSVVKLLPYLTAHSTKCDIGEKGRKCEYKE